MTNRLHLCFHKMLFIAGNGTQIWAKDLKLSNTKDEGPGHGIIIYPGLAITLLKEEVIHNHGYLHCSARSFHHLCRRRHI